VLCSCDVFFKFFTRFFIFYFYFIIFDFFFVCNMVILFFFGYFQMQFNANVVVYVNEADVDFHFEQTNVVIQL